MNKCAPERTGWRDENISRRHRLWGCVCSAFDIDFLLIECDRCEPVAIIEYKSEYAKMQSQKNTQYRALRKLGDRAQLPVLSVRYKMDFSSFIITACNGYALTLLNQEMQIKMSEPQYVTLLYRLRGYAEVPQEVLNSLQVRS